MVKVSKKILFGQTIKKPFFKKGAVLFSEANVLEHLWKGVCKSKHFLYINRATKTIVSDKTWNWKSIVYSESWGTAKIFEKIIRLFTVKLLDQQ